MHQSGGGTRAESAEPAKPAEPGVHFLHHNLKEK